MRVLLCIHVLSINEFLMRSKSMCNSQEDLPYYDKWTVLDIQTRICDLKVWVLTVDISKAMR